MLQHVVLVLCGLQYTCKSKVVSIVSINSTVISGFLVDNKVSAHIISNHISAVRAMSIVYDLPYQPWDHPKVKSIKLTRAMALPKQNIIDIQTLNTIIAYTQFFFGSCGLQSVISDSIFRIFQAFKHCPTCNLRAFSCCLNGRRQCSIEINTS